MPFANLAKLIEDLQGQLPRGRDDKGSKTIQLAPFQAIQLLYNLQAISCEFCIVRMLCLFACLAAYLYNFSLQSLLAQKMQMHGVPDFCCMLVQMAIIDPQVQKHSRRVFKKQSV